MALLLRLMAFWVVILSSPDAAERRYHGLHDDLYSAWDNENG